VIDQLFLCNHVHKFYHVFRCQINVVYRSCLYFPANESYVSTFHQNRECFRLGRSPIPLHLPLRHWCRLSTTLIAILRYNCRPTSLWIPDDKLFFKKIKTTLLSTSNISASGHLVFSFFPSGIHWQIMITDI